MKRKVNSSSQMLFADGPLVCSEQPAFKQGSHSMHAGQRNMSGVPRRRKHHPLPTVNVRWKRVVATPTISNNYCARLYHIADETDQALVRSVRDSAQSNPTESFGIMDLQSHCYDGFLVGLTAIYASFLAPKVHLTYLHTPYQFVSSWANHGPAYLVHPGPCRLVTTKASDTHQTEGIPSRILTGEIPTFLKPSPKRLAGPLQNGARHHRCLSLTGRAPYLPPGCPPSVFTTTGRANKSSRPTNPHQIIGTSIISREPLYKDKSHLSNSVRFSRMNQIYK